MTDTWLHNPRSGAPCTITVEVGQAHDGSLGMAHAFIDSIAKSGADAVKFQTHIAAAESTRDEPWRTQFSSQDATRIDYWRRMEFGEAQWLELRSHAADRDLLFLSSPFSLEAVELLSAIGVAGWKIASGEMSNHALIDAMAVTGLPMIISTGMSGLAEVDEVVDRIRTRKVPLAVLQCTSAYPCPPELVGLNVIGKFRERYACAVGLSDHSATIYPGLAAATQGIEVLEVHLTLSREMFGADVPASVTPGQLRSLVDGIRFIETMRANPVDKEIIPEHIGSLRKIFTKSVVVTVRLEPGTVLERTHLAAKKPGSGIPANALGDVVGRRLARAVVPDQLLSYEDLE